MTHPYSYCRHADVFAALQGGELQFNELTGHLLSSAAGHDFFVSAAEEGCLTLAAADSGRLRPGVDLRHAILQGALWQLPADLAARVEGRAAARQQTLAQSAENLAQQRARRERQGDHALFLRLAPRMAEASAAEWRDLLRVMLNETTWLRRNAAGSVEFLTQMQQRFEGRWPFTPSPRQLKWLCDVTRQMQRDLSHHLQSR